MISDEQYTNARMIEERTVWDKMAKILGTRWQAEVIAYTKSSFGDVKGGLSSNFDSLSFRGR